MRNLRDSRGFTLIELMIVVVIIGILAAIAIPKFAEVSNSAKEAEADPILKQICSLAEAEYLRHNTWALGDDLTMPPGWDDRTNGDPEDGGASYYTFSYGGDADAGTATATARDGSGVATKTMNCVTRQIEAAAAAE